MKKEQEKLPENNEQKKENEVSRRDFLVGAGTVVVGGAISSGLLSGCKGDTQTVTQTTTKTVPTTVTVGNGTAVTSTITEQVDYTTTVTTTLAEEGEIPPEKTTICSLGLAGDVKQSGAAAIDTKGGKLLRIRPLHWSWKYSDEHLNRWNITAKGSTFESSDKTLLSPYNIAYKKRVYSPNRIKYPLQRIDWEPGGDPEKINAQNRGISKFKRISWDEAAQMIADEILRIKNKYGIYAVLTQEGSAHGEGKAIHSTHGCNTELLDLMGGHSVLTRNPDSWEGWYWGAKHMWGMEPFGLMSPTTNIVKGIAENTEILVWAGGDPEATTWICGTQNTSRLCFWYSSLGIKQVWVCPDLNYGAAVHASKWIPVLPNTDMAWQLALAYIWINESTYDMDYIETHTTGFDKFQDYVLGNEDGIPKTPEWASPLCGIPVCTIKALAREWASKTTSTAHVTGGSYIRGPYSHEPARLEIALLSMQGVGKLGVYQYYLGGLPSPAVTPNLAIGQSFGHGSPRNPFHLPESQIVAKPLFPEIILNGGHDNPISWYGNPGVSGTPDQFMKNTFPLPQEEGGTDIHMFWTDCPCFTTCWNGGNRYIEAMRSNKLECIVAQHPWLENDMLYTDIILPVNTKFEEDDIGGDTFGETEYKSIFPEWKCIEPIGESKSDYEAVGEVAKKLGLSDEYTQGKTVEEFMRIAFDNSGVQDMITWDEFVEKGYYVVPTQENWEDAPIATIGFYEDPDHHPLYTASGKIDFYSPSLAEYFPDDSERPPLPHWIADGETHHESLLSDRANTYPLLFLSNHPRYRTHAQHDDISWMREIPTCKVKGPDGYLYEPVWLHPQTASERGIVSGDIVSVYNERGMVLGGAYVTERLMPGVVSMDHGSRCDPIAPGIDRGGANNLICPEHTISKNATGMASSGYLVEAKKADMADLRSKYPEAFAREYDPASGLRYHAWIEGGMD